MPYLGIASRYMEVDSVRVQMKEDCLRADMHLGPHDTILSTTKNVCFSTKKPKKKKPEKTW
jgi:hypothetical protein